MNRPPDAPDEATRPKAGPRPVAKVVLDDDGYVRDDFAHRVVVFIVAYRRQHRQGSTWGEVGAHMGWGREERTVALHILRAHRIVYFTGKPRSLQLHARLRPARQRGAASLEVS